MVPVRWWKLVYSGGDVVAVVVSGSGVVLWYVWVYSGGECCAL